MLPPPPFFISPLNRFFTIAVFELPFAPDASPAPAFG
jgi:hypothetical protein